VEVVTAVEEQFLVGFVLEAVHHLYVKAGSALNQEVE
jgi:hypothetical protein